MVRLGCSGVESCWHDQLGVIARGGHRYLQCIMSRCRPALAVLHAGLLFGSHRGDPKLLAIFNTKMQVVVEHGPSQRTLVARTRGAQEED
jgi:hypothetical protein